MFKYLCTHQALRVKYFVIWLCSNLITGLLNYQASNQVYFIYLHFHWYWMIFLIFFITTLVPITKVDFYCHSIVIDITPRRCSSYLSLLFTFHYQFFKGHQTDQKGQCWEKKKWRLSWLQHSYNIRCNSMINTHLFFLNNDWKVFSILKFNK